MSKKRPDVFVPTKIAQLEKYLSDIDPSRAAGWDTEADVQSYKLRKGTKPVIMPTTARLVGASVWGVGLPAMYIPFRHQSGGNIEAPGLAMQALYEWLCQRYANVDGSGEVCPNGRTWAFNLGFDLQVWRNEGEDSIVSSKWLDDSSVSSWLAGMQQDKRGNKFKKPTLKFLAEYVCGLPHRDVFEDVSKGRQSSAVPVSEMAQYAAWDAYDAAYLGELSWKRLKELKLTDHYRNIDMPLVEIIRGMEAKGWNVDAKPLEELRPYVQSEMARLKSEFAALTETFVRETVTVKKQVGTFKNGNPQIKKVEEEIVSCRGADVSKDREVSRWLYDELGWWPKSQSVQGKDGAWTVSKEVISLFEDMNVEGHKAVELRLQYNLFSKLASTYLDPIIRIPAFYPDGRLHTSLLLTGTQTQRFSSRNPNIQNMPSRSKEGKAIRAALVAPPGYKVVVCDLSQAELRIAAHLSRDPKLLEVYGEGKIDIHSMTLAALQASWPEAQRTDAKVVNFSILYNITAPKLAAKMRCSVEIAETAIDAYFASYTRLRAFLKWCETFVEENGYMRTVDGFKRPLDNKLVKDRRTGTVGLHWSVRNQCANTAIQGSVAGIAKIWMINVDKEIRETGWDAWLIAQEHDSLVSIVAEAQAEAFAAVVKRLGETAVKLRVPMVADVKIGKSWGECK